MGREKNTSNQTSQSTMSPEEREFLANQNRISSAGAQGQIDLNNNAFSLLNSLLQGQALPGYLSGLPGGISPEVTQGIVNQSLQDIAPRFQSSGILDSGVAAQISGRTAADIRNQSAQFNLQNLQGLLGMALTGQQSAQQPLIQGNAQLAQSLQGLRSNSTSGSTYGMNPFLKSFQTSLGQGIGSIPGRFGQGTGMFGGGSLGF